MIPRFDWARRTVRLSCRYFLSRTDRGAHGPADDLLFSIISKKDSSLCGHFAEKIDGMAVFLILPHIWLVKQEGEVTCSCDYWLKKL